MIALYIVAAGIVAAAVALMLARTPAKLRTADQRGITLQTLIVTAVLVLMAGAAGVVIIAITNNAQDNLEGQNSGIDSRCDPWEIFDPTLDAAGRGGGNGGIDSSASGCVRVCYVRYKLGTAAVASATNLAATNNLRSATGLSLTSGYPPALTGSPNATGSSILLFSRSNIFSGGNTSSTDHTLPVNGERSVDIDGNTRGETELSILNINTQTSALDNLVIELAPNQRYCRVWNNTDDEEVLRSRN